MTQEIKIETAWQLMGVNELPAFYTEITMNAGDKVVLRAGAHMNGAALYIFTDEPHPDDPKRKRTYVLPTKNVLGATIAALKDAKETEAARRGPATIGALCDEDDAKTNAENAKAGSWADEKPTAKRSKKKGK